jgi:hypothetical protein
MLYLCSLCSLIFDYRAYSLHSNHSRNLRSFCSHRLPNSHHLPRSLDALHSDHFRSTPFIPKVYLAEVTQASASHSDHFRSTPFIPKVYLAEVTQASASHSDHFRSTPFIPKVYLAEVTQAGSKNKKQRLKKNEKLKFVAVKLMRPNLGHVDGMHNQLLLELVDFFLLWKKTSCA